MNEDADAVLHRERRLRFGRAIKNAQHSQPLSVSNGIARRLRHELGQRTPLLGLLLRKRRRIHDQEREAIADRVVER
jgi:hypothetical protein